MPLPAMLLAVVFVTLAGVHFGWALSGSMALEKVVPTRGGKALFSPSRAATLGVAVLLLVAAFVSLWRGGAVAAGPRWVPRVGVWAIAALFAARAVGDFNYCGFFKRVRGTPFARNDTLVYSPLCAGIAALAVWLSVAY